MDIKDLLLGLPLFGGVIAFGFGVYQYFQNEKRQAEARLLEARKPFLEIQLKLYTEATQLASRIATHADSAETSKSLGRFWELFWGELALVEDKQVENAMCEFSLLILDGVPKEQLQKSALKLAHACRSSLATSWGVKDWERPVHQEPQSQSAKKLS